MAGAQSPCAEKRYDHRRRRQQRPGVSTQIANSDMLLIQRRASDTQGRKSEIPVTAARKRRSLNIHAPNIRTAGDETLPSRTPEHHDPNKHGTSRQKPGAKTLTARPPVPAFLQHKHVAIPPPSPSGIAVRPTGLTPPKGASVVLGSPAVRTPTPSRGLASQIRARGDR